METSTRIPVPGTYNFRDVGGLTARDGVVRDGLLFRSDGLFALGDAGRAALRELGVGTVIDLRDQGEAEVMPDDLEGLDVEVRRLPVFEGSGASHAPGGITLEALYERIVTRHSAVVASAVREIAAPNRQAREDRAVIVHCTAGKDRTGVVIALTLLALGVGRDDVIADYERTEANLAGAWLDGMVARYGAYGVVDTPALRTLMGGSPAEAIDSAITLVERRHGTARDYLLESGLTPPELSALESLLLDRG